MTGGKSGRKNLKKSEVLVGLFNVLGLVCLVAGPELFSYAGAAVAGSGFFAMGLGVIMVDTCRDLSGQKEENDVSR